MIDIVQRLRFDAIRVEAQFSKGVAGNINDAAAEIERLRAELASLTRDDIEAPHPDGRGQNVRMP